MGWVIYEGWCVNDKYMFHTTPLLLNIEHCYLIPPKTLLPSSSSYHPCIKNTFCFAHVIGNISGYRRYM